MHKTLQDWLHSTWLSKRNKKNKVSAQLKKTKIPSNSTLKVAPQSISSQRRQNQYHPRKMKHPCGNTRHPYILISSRLLSVKMCSNMNLTTNNRRTTCSRWDSNLWRTRSNASNRVMKTNWVNKKRPKKNITIKWMQSRKCSHLTATQMQDLRGMTMMRSMTSCWAIYRIQ